jgi:hypothetical protein
MHTHSRRGETARHVRRKSGTSVLESAYAAAQKRSSIASSRTTLLTSMAVVWVLQYTCGVEQITSHRQRAVAVHRAHGWGGGKGWEGGGGRRDGTQEQPGEMQMPGEGAHWFKVRLGMMARMSPSAQSCRMSMPSITCPWTVCCERWSMRHLSTTAVDDMEHNAPTKNPC